jgi:hypothetical protein
MPGHSATADLVKKSIDREQHAPVEVQKQAISDTSDLAAVLQALATVE